MADDTLRLQLSVPKEHAQAAFQLFKARGTQMALAPLEGHVEAIEAASASVQTMAGGNLRLFVDVEPRHAGAAFERFGSQGTSLALAAIKPEHLRQRVAEAEQRKQQRMETRGGSKAALAAQWCNDPQFQTWLQCEPTTDPVWLWALDQSGPGPRNVSEIAAMVVREICGIESRSHLDADARAWECFNKRIRQPFMAWKGQQP
jgi:hypothetical protein